MMVADLVEGCWSGKGLVMLEAARELLRTGIRLSYLHARKRAKGTLLMSAGASNTETLARVEAAFLAAGARTAKPATGPIKGGVAKRLSWSKLDPLVKGNAKVGLWIGPMDMHGGWARIPGQSSATDPLLDVVVGSADELDVLKGKGT